MPLSAFNLYVDDYPEAGATLVHNTFTGAYAVLPAAQLVALRKADRGVALLDDERDLVEDVDLRDPDVGVVVGSRAAEEAEFRAWFQQRRQRKGLLDVTVGVNLACNFECPYCSQAGVLDGTTMPSNVVALTAQWIATRALEVGVEAVEIKFVGGEPLLHIERVKQIAGAVRDALAPHGVSFRFLLITNGYFLSAEVVAELVPFGLTRAQVTLDGDETTHSITRVSKKGEDTFQRIFDNVIAASRAIGVVVRGNYTSDTVHGFMPLVDKLAEAGLTPGSVISFQPAVGGLSAEGDPASSTCTWAGSDTRYQVALFDGIVRSGFNPGAPLHTIGPCEFHDHHSFAIDPDGTIYKCPGFLGHPEWGIGHVGQGLTPRYQQMLRINSQRECGSCGHRPNCAGGCIAAEWMANGRMDGVACEKSYFDEIKDASLPRSYLLATRGDAATAVAEFPPAAIAFPVRVSAPLPAPRGRRSQALRVLAA